ncbi:phosphomannomutase/phosphoglucomutase [Candidatus Dependentiae bacterium]|nr:phosphomannomutase/phosphoglucomutase [Candidatus Dependentiae bacterium]
MKDVVFRQYDIRGKVGSEFIIDDVYDLTYAIADYFMQRDLQVKVVAVGMDGRSHSKQIKQHVCAVLADSGFDVLFIGVCPSPVLYFAMHTMSIDAGLMITASHNPKEYNGIKICFGKEMVWGNEIVKIRELFKQKKRVNTKKKGIIKEYPVIPAYIDYLAQQFDFLKNMPLRAIVDCANGVAGTVLPQLVRAMKWQHVHLLYEEVNGDYPNHEADPTVEHNMQDLKKLLAETDAQIGLGLDGDCDRMAPMTKDGFLVPGDQLLGLFAQPIIKQHPGSIVVFDVKASSALIEILKKWGARPIMSATGHSLIKDTMNKHSAILGGELSCHFFFHDRYFGYDDGVYAMMRLFELILISGKSLKELLLVIPERYSSPEYRIDCDEQDKQSIVDEVRSYFEQQKKVKMITIDGVRVVMPYGWALIRASNTQPVLSLRFESDTKQGLQKIKQESITVLANYNDKNELERAFNV